MFKIYFESDHFIARNLSYTILTSHLDFAILWPLDENDNIIYHLNWDTLKTQRGETLKVVLRNIA